MSFAQKVFPGMYRDSVALMQLSSTLSNLPGISQAAAIMATEANVALLREAGLLNEDPVAGPNDLLLVIFGENEQSVVDALEWTNQSLTRALNSNGSATDTQSLPRSLEMALLEAPGANLAMISCPGEFAGAEALKALHLGLNVMLFSNNVSIEDEALLKELGDELDLMVMGPDCGTAIINGVPLGFANVVSSGNIGLVAASGTGLQQVCCLIDRAGAGVSQAIGTGGRDLKSRIGGRTMIKAIKALASDPGTDVITLISKPPDRDVAERVLEVAGQCGKPVIVNFLGDLNFQTSYQNIFCAKTLEETAYLAVAKSQTSDAVVESVIRHNQDLMTIKEMAESLATDQSCVRGLYSGGTFAYEAQLLLEPGLGTIQSATPLNVEGKLADAWISRGHTIVDLGDDVFTRGRPHPMIDHRLRNERIVQEAEDPETGIILLDVVLGYGAHEDPAAVMAPAIMAAQQVARESDRTIHFVAFVCGTMSDPQDFLRQEKTLVDVGVILTENNAQAVRLAMDIVLEKAACLSGESGNLAI